MNWSKLFFRSLLCIVFLVAFNRPLFVEAQTEANVGLHEAVQTRSKSILAEILALGDHDWAGEYSQTAGTDSVLVLTLSPDCGAVFQLRGNSQIAAQGFGKIEVHDSRLMFQWEEASCPIASLTSELVVVRYKSRIFLIPPSGIHAFCLGRDNAYSRGFYMSRVNFNENDDPNQFRLTGEYGKFIDQPRTKGTVIDTKEPQLNGFGKSFWVTQSTTLDIGLSQNVEIGSVFVACDNSKIELRVTSVNEGKAAANLIANFLPRVGFTPLSIGQEFCLGRRALDLAVFNDGEIPYQLNSEQFETTYRNGRLFRLRGKTVK